MDTEATDADENVEDVVVESVLVPKRGTTITILIPLVNSTEKQNEQSGESLCEELVVEADHSIEITLDPSRLDL